MVCHVVHSTAVRVDYIYCNYVRARLRREGQWTSSDHIDEERAAGHVLVAPLDDEHVLPAFSHSIRNQEAPVAHVLHGHLLCRRRGPERTDQKHIRPTHAQSRCVHCEWGRPAHLYIRTRDLLNYTRVKNILYHCKVSYMRSPRILQESIVRRVI